MKSEQEIRTRLEWLLKAIDDPENQSEMMQSKLFAQIDFIKWLGVE